MDEKHLVWGSIVLFIVFWGEPDLLGSIISYTPTLKHPTKDWLKSYMAVPNRKLDSAAKYGCQSGEYTINKEQQESFKERKITEDMQKSRGELNRLFGGEEEADKHIKVAKSVLNQYAQESDKIFVADSGLGNSPEFIELLSKIGAMLETAREKENRK